MCVCANEIIRGLESSKNDFLQDLSTQQNANDGKDMTVLKQKKKQVDDYITYVILLNFQDRETHKSRQGGSVPLIRFRKAQMIPTPSRQNTSTFSCLSCS